MTVTIHFFTRITAKRTAILTRTILAPVGRLILKDKIIPKKKHTIDKTTDVHTTALKLPTSFPAVTAGKIIRLEIRRLPIILIPNTTARAVKRAMINW